jgi:hypothetical protein
MPSRIHDLAQLGYEISLAHGSVAVEEEALAEAERRAAPEQITAEAETLLSRTVEEYARVAQAAGVSPEEQAAMIARLAEQIPRLLKQGRDERVEFHRRALEIARSMPDVWVVSGPGVERCYIACKADGTGWDEEEQGMIERLADPAAHRERVFQAYAPPEVVEAVIDLRRSGVEVDAEADENGFRVRVNGREYRSAGALRKAAQAATG